MKSEDGLFLENIKNTQVLVTCTDKIISSKIDFIVAKVLNGKIYENEDDF